jgi:hypothetical protein
VGGYGQSSWCSYRELGRSGRHVWEEAFALLAIVKIERNLCTILYLTRVSIHSSSISYSNRPGLS